MYRAITLAFGLNMLLWLGCKSSQPTSIAMINASGRELTGKVVIKNDIVPYADNSLYTGLESYRENESINISLKDIWSGDTYSTSTVVPPQKTDDQGLLLVCIRKDLSILTTWKNDTTSLKDRKNELFLQDFQVLPIVVRNEGSRADYLTRLIQSPYVYRCDRLYVDDSIHFINYGFLITSADSTDCKVTVTYGSGTSAKTCIAAIPKVIILANQNATTAYLHIDQAKHIAKLRFLEKTDTDPRRVAEDILLDRIDLTAPPHHIDVKRIAKHLDVDGFVIPDLSIPD